MNESIKKLTRTIQDKLFHINANKNWINPTRELVDSLVVKCLDIGCTYQEPLNKLKLVVFDTETTGFDPDKGDEIISISGVKIEEGRLTEHFDALVNPHRPVPPIVTELTGICDKMLMDKPNIFHVLDDFLSFAKYSVLVAHHAAFDMSFINYKLKNHCQTKLNLPVLDTGLIAKVLFPTLPRYDLDFLIEQFDLPKEGRHTSLGDSLITAQLFLKLAEVMSNQQMVTLKDLKLTLRWRHLTTSSTQN
ncbi:MAG: 3'-5' exonuclease [Clostridia bacterium]|nr:3'-5' exonuclease [Clostridia bacterium]